MNHNRVKAAQTPSWMHWMRFEMKYVFSPRPGVYYYRRKGRYWGRLNGEPGSVEFAQSYEVIHSTFGKGRTSAPVPGTFDALAVAYLQSAEYLTNLKPKTQAAYRLDLDMARKVFGPHRASDIQPAHILKLRDKLASKPGTANTVMRTLRVLFSWGIVRGLVKSNPADLSSMGVKALRLGEHQPWPPEALAKFREKARPHLVLAMELALWTGQRQGDLVRLKWSDIRDGVIRLVQEKTGKEAWIPVSAPLARVLAGAPRTAVTVLTNTDGRPWRTANVLAQAFGDELKALGLPYVFHGLRKTTAVMLAEHGCTTKQIAAITRQSDQMVSHYTKGVNQAELAQQAVTKLEQKMIRRPTKDDTGGAK